VGCERGGVSDAHHALELIEYVKDGQEDHWSRRIDDELPQWGKLHIRPARSGLGRGECEKCEGASTHLFGGWVVDERRWSSLSPASSWCSKGGGGGEEETVLGLTD
jgi:hypothetical protein